MSEFCVLFPATKKSKPSRVVGCHKTKEAAVAAKRRRGLADGGYYEVHPDSLIQSWRSRGLLGGARRKRRSRR